MPRGGRGVFTAGCNAHFSGADMSADSGRPIRSRQSEAQLKKAVADLEKTVRSLLDSEERYRTLLALVPDIVYSVDPRGNFTFLSRSIHSLGYEPAELMGKHFSAIVHPNDIELCARDEVLERYRGMITGDENAPKLFDERRTGKRMTRGLKVRLVRASGREAVSRGGAPDAGAVMYADVTATGRYSTDVSERDKEFLGTVGVIRDITAQRNAEQERARLEEELRQAQKMEAVGRLAGGIAHDFNNMLGAISGYAEMIKKKFGIDNPKLDKYADTILSAARRVADLTSKLLVFARVSKVEMIETDLHKVVDDVVMLLARTVEKNIAIRQRLDASASLVLGDRSQLQSAILNIALNARDAMPEGGELLFGTDIVTLDAKYIEQQTYYLKPGSYLLLTIDDTGVGMDESTRARIFEPFFTTKETGKGTGMGLASAYGTVKSHNGYINIYSEVGHGTSVKVYLPLSPDAVPPAEGIQEDQPVAGSGHIMVIDDEEYMLNVSQEMLSDLGYRVTTCRSGARAIKLFETMHEQIDLVIVDMIMPECTGRECLKGLRGIDPGVRAVLATGYSMNTEVKELLGEGFVEFIQKPFTGGKLSQVVAKALRGR
ncbi:MAG: response regulator [Chitinivibrionales bacterium]|nr:response regulator [Chitinivibrionales bacterium]MBD3395368.1 response regulator [Chitinivibrionales bacterium]